MASLDLSLDDLIKKRNQDVPRGGGGGGGRQTRRGDNTAQHNTQQRSGTRGSHFPRGGQKNANQTTQRAAPKQYQAHAESTGTAARRHQAAQSGRARRGKAMDQRRGMDVEEPTPSGGGSSSNIFDRLGPKRPSDDAVRVTNVPYDVLEDDLRQLFGTVGGVTDVKIDYDASGRSKGTATVRLDSARAAKAAAVKYDGTTIDGRAIKVAQQGGAAGGARASAAPAVGGTNVRAGLFGTALQGITSTSTTSHNNNNTNKPQRRRRGRGPGGGSSSNAVMDTDDF